MGIVGGRGKGKKGRLETEGLAAEGRKDRGREGHEGREGLGIVGGRGKGQKRREGRIFRYISCRGMEGETEREKDMMKGKGW